eukprot:3137451-Rhodomonas_salina.3
MRITDLVGLEVKSQTDDQKVGEEAGGQEGGGTATDPHSAGNTQTAATITSNATFAVCRATLNA